MLIVKIEEDSNTKLTRKIKFKRKDKSEILNYSSSGIVINNKPHFVINVTEKMLENEEFAMLLNNYKGNVLVNENFETHNALKNLIFDVKPYIKRAIFENLLLLLKTGKFKRFNLLLNDNDLTLKNELHYILPYVKSLTVTTESFLDFEKFKDECFCEYGVKPTITNRGYVYESEYDLIFDFEKINDNELEYFAINKYEYLYPNFEYLEVPEGVKILENYNISRTMLCAAFKNL